MNTQELREYQNDIITLQLLELQEKLKEHGYDVDVDDFIYDFGGGSESLSLPSSLLTDGEDLPEKIGVYRSYIEGGMHSELQRSETHHAKLEEVLEAVENAFWGILGDIDSLVEAATGEEHPEWERAIF